MQLKEFINNWQDDGNKNKQAFLFLQQHLEALESVTLGFVPRPGITYSLRARHEAQSERQLFVIIDVIEGEPRWLSVCFYTDMITDPEERSNLVPGGLLGEDAFCFDIEQHSEGMLNYLVARMDEAIERACIQK